MSQQKSFMVNSICASSEVASLLPNWASFVPLRFLNALAFHAAAAASQIKPLFQALSVSALSIWYLLAKLFCLLFIIRIPVCLSVQQIQNYEWCFVSIPRCFLHHTKVCVELFKSTRKAYFEDKHFGTSRVHVPPLAAGSKGGHYFW